MDIYQSQTEILLHGRHTFLQGLNHHKNTRLFYGHPCSVFIFLSGSTLNMKVNYQDHASITCCNEQFLMHDIDNPDLSRKGPGQMKMSNEKSIYSSICHKHTHTQWPSHNQTNQSFIPACQQYHSAHRNVHLTSHQAYFMPPLKVWPTSCEEYWQQFKIYLQIWQIPWKHACGNNFILSHDACISLAILSCVVHKMHIMLSICLKYCNTGCSGMFIEILTF